MVNVENIVCYLLEEGRGYGHEIILFVSVVESLNIDLISVYWAEHDIVASISRY